MTHASSAHENATFAVGLWGMVLTGVILSGPAGMAQEAAAPAASTKPAASAIRAAIPETNPPQPIFATAAVAADHPLASEAGVAMLRAGGNVIDAAVATAVTLSIVRPASSGLGGGGFLIVWDAETQAATAYDYRERAPLSATADMYLADYNAGRKSISRHGGKAVAVPLAIPGLCRIHAERGKLPLATVLEPALRIARDGYPVDRHDIELQQRFIAEFGQTPALKSTYAGLWERYLNSGVPWKVGERFFSPQRAALEALSRDGLAAFLTGELGQSIRATVNATGGNMTALDFADAAPIVRPPLRFQYRGLEVITMPPPSSGGVVLVQTLQALEAWSDRLGQTPWRSLPEADRTHLLAEILKHGFADRAEYLGDTDHVSVPLARLTSPAYAFELAKRLDLRRVRPEGDYGRFTLPEDAGTTHFSVMDARGNAVACTETINTTFGSYVVEPKFGLVLNNEMDDFTAIPGQPNAFRLMQSAANAVGPKKKPLSSMTPTLVLKNGRPILAVGASGGPRIITATIQSLLRVIDLEWSPAKAVSDPRIHHQWQPHEILVEHGLYERIGKDLEGRGQTVRLAPGGLAVSQAIRWSDRGLEPASDPRKHGQPAGY